jgi:hypothetical protein
MWCPKKPGPAHYRHRTDTDDQRHDGECADHPSDHQEPEGASKGNRITWDTDVTGFGVRITAGSALAFVLRYVFQGRERVITIGRHPDLSPTAAREHAIRMRGEIVVRPRIPSDLSCGIRIQY